MRERTSIAVTRRNLLRTRSGRPLDDRIGAMESGAQVFHAPTGRQGRLMESQRAANSQPAPFRACYRMLVVDDNKDAAESLQFLLKLLGAEVRIAHDGIE